MSDLKTFASVSYHNVRARDVRVRADSSGSKGWITIHVGEDKEVVLYADTPGDFEELCHTFGVITRETAEADYAAWSAGR